MGSFMGVEIEKKFLVKDDNWKLADDGVPIEGVRFRQGYLPDNGVTVRIRVRRESAYLTLKGKTQGISRLEYEYPIPLQDANEMLEKLCEKPLIEKVRYIRKEYGLTWEIDVFEGDNAGLVVAEVELCSEQQAIELPEWVGSEVSTDQRYFNVNLARNPFKNWYG